MRVPADPELLRHRLHELKFGARRVARRRESETVRDALHMRIHDERRLVVDVAENQVPRLAADARERGELVNAVGHDAVIAREALMFRALLW